jgi:maltooligosyltrehalose trehalohydrolase
MTEIRVWAPNARQVVIESQNRTVNMARNPAGWWTAEAPFICHGVDYAFRIDGEGPFPDPRSGWQPEGVHGPSRWVDHADFAWSDDQWRQPPMGSAVIYEMHVGTFTAEGGFESAIECVDYLADLGITHLELMPVAEFSGARGWGYDGVDLYAPHHAYGGPEGLKRLVDACHQRGLAVLLDVVYNHLGPAGNYLERFGPYFTDRYATPWGQAVNLDGPGSDEVRRFFIDNALMWLRDYHMDGLRVDAVHAIVDTSAIHFLEQLAAEVKQLEAHLGRSLILIAESDLNDPRVVRSPELGGYGFDAQWNEDFHHALHAVLTGEREGYYQDYGAIADLAKALTRGFIYDGCYSLHRRRRHGRPATGLSGHRFVGCLQNHDQVGNRAMGERISHLLPPERLKLGAALVMTAPFIPMLFQGEEWAASAPFLYFTDHQDPELGEAVKQGRRDEFAAFGWEADAIADPQSEDAFLRSRLDGVEFDKPPHAEMFEWHRALIDLRRRLPALQDGRMEQTTVDFDEAAQWLMMARGSVLVVVNFANEAQTIPLTGCSRKTLLLSSGEGVVLEDGAISMPSNIAAILKDERNDAFNIS